MLPIDLAKFYYRPSNPFPPPARRYRLAEIYLAHDLKPSVHLDDRATWEVYRFLRAELVYRHPRRRVNDVIRRYPELWTAFEMHHRGMRSLRPVIEAFLVAGTKADAIASRIGVSPEAVAWFALAFYDIADRRDNTYYVLTKLIGVLDNEGQMALDMPSVWKLVGFACGPAALDELLNQGNALKDAYQTRGVTGWLTQKTQTMLQTKLLQTISNLNPKYEDDRKLLLKLLGQIQRETKQSDDSPIGQVEQHVKAMLEQFTWVVGPKEMPEALQPYQETSAELRYDEELMLVSAAEGCSLDEEIKDLSFEMIAEARQPRAKQQGNDTHNT